MIWLSELIVAAALGAVIAAVALAPNRNSATRIIGVILALSLLLIGAFYFWKAAIIALAIATVCSLAGGMRFQKSYIPKAMGGAFGTFVLLFLLSWLTLLAADVLLFGRDSGLLRLTYEFPTSFRVLGGHDIGGPGFWTGLGIACLIAACFLDRRLKVLALILGASLLLFFGPTLLERQGLFVRDLFYDRGLALKLAVLIAIVVGIIAIARWLRKTKNPKNP